MQKFKIIFCEKEAIEKQYVMTFCSSLVDCDQDQSILFLFARVQFFAGSASDVWKIAFFVQDEILRSKNFYFVSNYDYYITYIHVN